MALLRLLMPRPQSPRPPIHLMSPIHSILPLHGLLAGRSIPRTAAVSLHPEAASAAEAAPAPAPAPAPGWSDSSSLYHHLVVSSTRPPWICTAIQYEVEEEDVEIAGSPSGLAHARDLERRRCCCRCCRWCCCRWWCGRYDDVQHHHKRGKSHSTPSTRFFARVTTQPEEDFLPRPADYPILLLLLLQPLRQLSSSIHGSIIVPQIDDCCIGILQEVDFDW